MQEESNRCCKWYWHWKRQRVELAVVGCVVELAVVVTHSGDLCVPYDWDWHRKLFTLWQLGKASRLGTGLRFGQAGNVGDDGLVCVCVCVCVLWKGVSKYVWITGVGYYMETSMAK